jgi:GNAT superfamily N-acetyltransferase
MRDARPGDKAAVLAFTRRTWGEYGDFIPRVWDSWIGDRGGRFIVAELDGVPVGTAKITDFGGGEIWLEGLRVNPEYRGKGIARAINVEVIRTLGRMRPRAVRYCTGRTNWGSRHIGSRFGFEIAVRMRYYWMKARAGRLRGQFARPRDASEIYDFIRTSKSIGMTSGLVAEGWIFRELTPRLLATYIRQKRVMVIKRSGTVAGAAIYPMEKNDATLTMGFIDGDPAAVKALAANCPRLARARGGKSCSAAVPSRGFRALVEAAWPVWEESMGQVVLQHIRWSGARPDGRVARPMSRRVGKLAGRRAR